MVKQGGVISPILFCIYMDSLISDLYKSGVGCYMGGVLPEYLRTQMI